MVIGANLIFFTGDVMSKLSSDRHIGFPPRNESVKELKNVLNKLLGWKTICWPWIDLIVFYLEPNVFDVKKLLDQEFDVDTPIRHTKTGERIIVYRAGGHAVRLHYKKHSYQNDAGVEQSRHIGWIKLPDNPPTKLQAQIKQLIMKSGCRFNFKMVEFGIDIFPIYLYEYSSTLRNHDDMLVSVAWQSEKAGVSPALVAIQDTIERTIHLNYCCTGVLKEYGTTTYRRTRDKEKRLKNYLGPKHVKKADREFQRVELTLESRALRHHLKTGKGGMKFPLEVTELDFRVFFKLMVLKNFPRLVNALYRREMQGQDTSKNRDLLKFNIQKILAYDLERLAHAEFWDFIHSCFNGRNVAYWFKPVYQ